MPIIVREPGASSINDKNVPADWDKNTIDISKAPDNVQIAARGVCGLVHSGHITGFTPYLLYSVEAKLHQEFMVEMETTKKLIKTYALTRISQIFNEKRVLLQRTSNQINAPNSTATAAEKQAIADLLADLSHEELKYQDHLTKSDQGYIFLDRLPWPTESIFGNSHRIQVNFANERAPAFGSGFQIAQGYFMTADHVFTGQSAKWYKCQAAFRLHAPAPNSAKLAYDSLHDLKRVVLRTRSDGTKATHDVAIIEFSAGKYPFPNQVLNLRKVLPPVGTTPLGLLGHPKGLPLKYTSAYEGTDSNPNKTRPRITASEPTRERWKFPTIAADIDTFSGTSGGPLFLADSPTDVIGIVARFTSSFNNPRRNPPPALYAEVYKWLERQFVIAGWPKNRIAGERSAWEHCFRNWHIDSKNIVTEQQLMPSDPELPNQILFNRVDVFEPFINSVGKYLGQPNAGVRVIVEITLATQNHKIPLQPELYLEEPGKSNGIHNKLASQDRAPLQNPAKSVYRWIKKLQGMNDLNIAFQEKGGAAANGDIPSEVLRKDKGFMPWTRLIFETPKITNQAQEITSAEGKISVVYFADTRTDASLNDAVKFTNILTFEPNGERTTWTAYIGERYQKGKLQKLFGSAWGPPEHHDTKWDDPLDVSLQNLLPYP